MDLLKSILPEANGILPFYMLIVRISPNTSSPSKHPASSPVSS
jgi:hypothetical protein